MSTCRDLYCDIRYLREEEEEKQEAADGTDKVDAQHLREFHGRVNEGAVMSPRLLR